MSDQPNNENPQGGPGVPPPDSPNPQGGFTPPAAPTGDQPAGAPTASGYDPAAAAGRWAQQSYSSASLGDQPAVGIGPRFGARIIDTIILMVIGFFPLILAIGAATSAVYAGTDPTTMQASMQADPQLTQKLTAAYSLAFLLVTVPLYLIDEVVLVKLKGWNLGKLTLGQRVVDADSGEFLSWGKAFTRFAVYYGPAIVVMIIGMFVGQTASMFLSLASTIWYIALMVSIAMGGTLFQGWHDKAAGSKVVKKPAF